MLSFEKMCTGKNQEKADHYKSLARFNKMMSCFYLLNISDQKVFMAMFDQMVANSEAKE